MLRKLNILLRSMKRIQKKSAHKYGSWKILEWGIFQTGIPHCSALYLAVQFYYTGLMYRSFFLCFSKLRKATVCLSIRIDQLSSQWMDFHEIWNLIIFFKICPKKFQFHWSLTRIMDTLHDDIFKFVIISIWILL